MPTVNLVVHEVIGPTPDQGTIVVHARNVPNSTAQNVTDKWYVPAHCPVFLTQNGNIGLQDNVLDISPLPEAWTNGLAGVAMDGLYDAKMQRDQFPSEGIGRLSIAVAGLVTVAASPDDVKNFEYGDPVYVDQTPTRVGQLQDTQFRGCLQYTTSDTGREHLLGTFVSAVDPHCGGMRVMLAIGTPE